MSLSGEIRSAARQQRSHFAGWLWILLLVIGNTFTVIKLIPRDVFDLGEEAFVYVMFIGLPLVGLSLVTVICLLVIGALRLRDKHHRKWIPWTQLMVMVLCIGCVRMWSTTVSQQNPITPESEPVYLAIAAAARELLSEPNSEVLLYLDSSSDDYADSKVSSTARKQLDQLVPDYWPRSLLKIWMDRDCVVLARGSGMLGERGVRIYDLGPAVTYSAEELRANPYLPDQKRITDRLWFFSSN